MFPFLNRKRNRPLFQYCMIQTYKDIITGLHGFSLIVSVLFVVIYLVRMLYLFLFTGRILFRKPIKTDNHPALPLSLILTIRNDEYNLRKYLPGLLEIDGVDYEVIVVDDFSQDNSYLVLGSLRKEHKRLKISTLNEETRFSAKLAQNIAIKAASHDWVLTVPVVFNHKGKDWLSGIIKELTSDKTLVLSYSGIEVSSGLFNHLYRLENYFSFLKSTGLILNNLPVVYSDENVAFRKEEYFNQGGYRTKLKEPYANLELLMNLFIRKKTSSVLFTGDNSIKKIIEVTGDDYLDLIKKSFRIEKHISDKKKIFLFVEELTRLLFIPISLTVIILLPDIWIIFTLLLGIQFLAHLFIIKTTQNRLNERKIFISSLIYELFAPYFKFIYRWFFYYRSRKNRWRSKV